jgi:hypothetical protein
MGLFGLALAAAVMNAVVTAPVLNMYSQPGDDVDVVSQAIYGTNVGILERQDAWAKIQTSDGYTGWAPLSHLIRSERPYAASGRIANVESLFAHIYREPSVMKQRPLLTVPFETRLVMIAEDEGWLNVRLPDNASGWIQRGDVTFDAKPATVNETILLARRFLGLPYTWGGTSSYGFDCSGFTQMLCRRRGVSIPRDARPQAEWSGVAAVAKEDLQPGDLVYFGKGEGADRKITHTGMYIGAGEFIHATAHERPVVQISRLDHPHWTEVYICARRLK